MNWHCAEISWYKWRSNFVLFQGVKAANSLSYLKFLQRKKRAKGQARMPNYFCAMPQEWQN